MVCSLFFPIPLWKIEAEPIEGSIDWALQFEKDHPNSRVRSNEGGYQHDIDIDSFPYTEKLLEIAHELPQFTCDDMWLNINRKGDSNVVHCHPNIDMSIVWYLTDNENSFVLRNPNAYGMSAFFRSLNDGGIKIADRHAIGATAGDVIAFPACIEHYVAPHKGDEPRISLAFNAKIV